MYDENSMYVEIDGYSGTWTCTNVTYYRGDYLYEMTSDEDDAQVIIIYDNGEVFEECSLYDLGINQKVGVCIMASWYSKPYMYREVAKVDRDYSDECPEIDKSIPDYDIIYNFILDNRERFGEMYPQETVEYYQIKGVWCAGNGILDLYREDTDMYGTIYRLYKRVI